MSLMTWIQWWKIYKDHAITESCKLKKKATMMKKNDKIEKKKKIMFTALMFISL